MEKNIREDMSYAEMQLLPIIKAPQSYLRYYSICVIKFLALLIFVI